MVDGHLQITTYSVSETQKLGQRLGAGIYNPLIIALTGGLGSGKTAFVQGLAQGLEVSDKYYITSPTFTIINEYSGRYPLFHVDLYRIEQVTELNEIGLHEILHQQRVVAIEWAEKLSEIHLSGHLALQIKIISDETRQIDLFAYGQAAGDLLKVLKNSWSN